MIMDLKIAFIQYDLVWESKTLNFDYIESSYMSDLIEGEHDLILFPEMFATGFTMKPDEFYEESNGLTIKFLKKWSKYLKCCLGGGVITKLNSGKFLNSFVISDEKGQLTFYHKRHLFRMGEEHKFYTSGQSKTIIDVKGWKINLQICYDLRFPAFSRNRIKENQPIYDVLVYIANWPEVRSYAWTSLLLSRAIENQAYTIGVNRVGTDGNGIVHSGESACIGPDGRYLIGPINKQVGLFKTVLSADLLKASRKKFPVLLDADNFNIID